MTFVARTGVLNVLVRFFCRGVTLVGVCGLLQIGGCLFGVNAG